MSLAKVQSAKGVPGAVGTSVAISINTPVDGNLLIAFIQASQYQAARTVTPPAGWSTLFFVQYSSISLGCYYKKASGEGTNPTYTFNISGGTEWHSGCMMEIQGQDPATPINGYGSPPTENASSATIQGAAATPTVIGCLALMGASEDAGGANTDTIDSGWTIDQSARPTYHATDMGLKTALTTDTTTAIQPTITWVSSTVMGAVVLINPVLPNNPKSVNSYESIHAGSGMSVTEHIS